MGAVSTPVLEAVVTLGRPAKPHGCPLRAIARNVASAADSGEALRVATETRPDLIVIRETVAPAEGLAFLHEIRRAIPHSPVVVVSAQPDVDEAIRFIRGGARDYVVAPLDDGVLERVIEAAHAEHRERARSGQRYQLA